MVIRQVELASSQPYTRPKSRSLAHILRIAALLFAIAFTATASAARSPEVKVSRFESLPARLSYFDDSTVVLYHDSIRGNVYRSQDEGKSWAQVSGPPDGNAYMLVEHPYDKRMAFILSSSKIHWRSADRGATWQQFSTPEPPAVRAGPPLEFNADEKHYESIIFTGKKCKPWTPWGGSICHDEAYITSDGFATDPKPLIEFLVHCSWAKSSPELQVGPAHLNRIFCIAWEDSPTPDSLAPSGHSSSPWSDPKGMLHSLRPSLFGERSEMSPRRTGPSATRLFFSDDFFKTRHLVQLDMGRDAKNFIGLGPSKRYLVAALKDISTSNGGSAGSELAMFVSKNGDTWQKAQFPHGHGLKENAYTVVDSTLHSLVVDVVDAGSSASTGNLFTSDSEGVYFVKSLEGTHRDPSGIVDFEHLQNIEGVGIANVLTDDGPAGYDARRLRSKITWDDGSTWDFIEAPKYDGVKCDVKDIGRCSLNLYSVTKLHNLGRVFSSTAPGFVMGVGSVGDRLLPYEECDTFLSTDAGRSWKMISRDAHKYEFGDQGSILVIVDDEDTTDHVNYSFDQGESWQKLNLGVKVRAKILTTIPDSTSQKFLLIGTQSRKDAGAGSRHVSVFLDFAPVGKRKCRDSDFEKWAAVKQGNSASNCLMGHRQWFKRRKASADCVVADKFHDPVSREEPCPCTDEDYECDFGYVRDPGGSCVSIGREVIPAGECDKDFKKTYKGSSGYRKIPGNSCDASKGIRKDGLVEKPCDQGEHSPGTVHSRKHQFPGEVVDHIWFAGSTNLLAEIDDGSVWQSNDDGATWAVKLASPSGSDPDDRFLTMTSHEYDHERGYLITSGQRVWYTYNRGKHWDWFSAPLPANGLGIPILQFHPIKSDWLIWVGSEDCSSSGSSECHTKAWYSLDHGRNWHLIDSYVKFCQWARGKSFAVNSEAIVCGSYKNKKGSQRSFDSTNDLQLVWGTQFYKNKQVLFDSLAGMAVFEEFMVVAQLLKSSGTLSMQVSLDGWTFAPAHLPPDLHVDNRAYTVLDSVTKSLFLHVTTHSNAGTEWGSIVKSNGNGTYYTLSQQHVNRNSAGYVDFEKMLGLDGIAVINTVSNADDASVSGRKELQTLITHNDGGRWKKLIPPRADVFGAPYKCDTVQCSLHLHGFSERDDPTTSLSSPSAVGLMLGVGNVGEKLAPYIDSDTFLTRDGGFTWEEVHKDAHKWEFGDQGSIILLVNDEQPTDTVLYSLNEGLKWESYNFGERLRVKKILTVPEDTHRRFVLFGQVPGSQGKTVAVHLDFSALSSRKCKLDVEHPEADDFELWSPSEERSEPCLFGRQTYYYRRKRAADCFVGQEIVQPHEIKKNCTCTAADFECEFNHVRDLNTGKCVLQAGLSALPTSEEEQCRNGEDYWYERTDVRKIPFSSCDGGARPDRGVRHTCSSSYRRHGFLWWTTVILSPFAMAGVVGWWWVKRSGGRDRGSIRLPDPSSYAESPLLQTLSSVPYYLIGVSNTTWAWLQRHMERIPFFQRRFTRTRVSHGGYRGLAQDEDAAILRDYDDEDFEGRS
ncbi:unnamed protein product [Sympodiomycopsis kandeliae]